MRKCLICEKEYRETTEEQKYCDRVCKSAAHLNMTREQFVQQRQEREIRRGEEQRQAEEKGHGKYVIFRDDGGYNRTYLTSNGAWTVNRAEAARCLSLGEANELAKKHGVVFFGGPTASEPTCDLLCFTLPDQYDRWLSANGSEIDADDPYPTERFIEADFASVLPSEKAKDLLRPARTDASDGPQDTIRR